MPSKQQEHRWVVYLLGKKSERVGEVHAATEEEALEKATREMNVAPALRFKLAVRRE